MATTKEREKGRSDNVKYKKKYVFPFSLFIELLDRRTNNREKKIENFIHIFTWICIGIDDSQMIVIFNSVECQFFFYSTFFDLIILNSNIEFVKKEKKLRIYISFDRTDQWEVEIKMFQKNWTQDL